MLTLSTLLTQLTAHDKLQKIAALVPANAPTNEWALLKVAIEDEIFSSIKTAQFTPAFLKTLGYGAGVALPAGLLAKYVIDKKRDATSSVINTALGTALGTGALGVGLYGASKLMNNLPKRASLADNAAAAECAEKLATVGYLDDAICNAQLHKSAAEDQQHLAQLLRCNRAYGVQLLKEARDGGK